MDFKFESTLDKIDLNILHELQINARLSFSELGRRVGLSSPAVAERVRKMEETGIITGYHVTVDYEKIGFPILAFVLLTTQAEKYKKFYAFAENTMEITECHCISGEESFILRILTRSLSKLDDLIEKLTAFGETKTSIVLRSPLKNIALEI